MRGIVAGDTPPCRGASQAGAAALSLSWAVTPAGGVYDAGFRNARLGSVAQSTEGGGASAARIGGQHTVRVSRTDVVLVQPPRFDKKGGLSTLSAPASPVASHRKRSTCTLKLPAASTR